MNDKTYDARAAQASKLLQPDGSITTFDGTMIEPPSAERAKSYHARSAKAAMWMLPDGSIVAELPVSGGGSGTTDHTALINRDAADQHPIDAITGLQEKLGKVTDQDGDTRAVWIGVHDDLPETLDPATMYFVTEG